MASKVVPSISTVRHGDVPQTEQQGLLPTLAPSHSSIGFPAIQMRLDSEGLALNASGAISRVSNRGSIPKGPSDCLSLSIARCISPKVASQRSHVLPSRLTSRCQTIGNTFMVPQSSRKLRAGCASIGKSRAHFADSISHASAGFFRRSSKTSPALTRIDKIAGLHFARSRHEPTPLGHRSETPA
jgi:hypothetical protein